MYRFISLLLIEITLRMNFVSHQEAEISIIERVTELFANKWVFATQIANGAHSFFYAAGKWNSTRGCKFTGIGERNGCYTSGHPVCIFAAKRESIETMMSAKQLQSMRLKDGSMPREKFVYDRSWAGSTNIGAYTRRKCARDYASSIRFAPRVPLLFYARQNRWPQLSIKLDVALNEDSRLLASGRKKFKLSKSQYRATVACTRFWWASFALAELSD